MPSVAASRLVQQAEINGVHSHPKQRPKAYLIKL